MIRIILYFYEVKSDVYENLSLLTLIFLVSPMDQQP